MGILGSSDAWAEQAPVEITNAWLAFLNISVTFLTKDSYIDEAGQLNIAHLAPLSSRVVSAGSAQYGGHKLT